MSGWDRFRERVDMIQNASDAEFEELLKAVFDAPRHVCPTLAIIAESVDKLGDCEGESEDCRDYGACCGACWATDG
jgi:hypothetical protein